MRYFLIAFAAIVVAFSPPVTVTFSDFGAKSGADGITLQWTTTQENGVKDFAVEKASQINGEFLQVDGTINATGAGSTYQFVDKEIYKTTSSTYFIYRIRADGFDGSVAYSGQIVQSYDFSNNISGVAKRTWGSIKAMFR